MVWFVYFSFTCKERRQNPATAPINIKIIHSFWVLRGFVTAPINIKIIHSFWVLIGFVMRENRKNLRIDWEKMYAIHLKLESN